MAGPGGIPEIGVRRPEPVQQHQTLAPPMLELASFEEPTEVVVRTAAGQSSARFEAVRVLVSMGCLMLIDADMKSPSRVFAPGHWKEFFIPNKK